MKLKRKKYVIHDENGEEFKVEEIAESTHDEDEEIIEEVHDDDSLTSEEISALKNLARVADKLMALITTEDACDEEEEEIVEDEDFIEEKNEEVIDTEEEVKTKTRDSRKSFNSIENTRSKKIDDSLAVDEISEAWSKRFNGGRN